VAGRRPDVRWRRGPEDPDRLAGLQRELLAAAAELLAPGGAVLYCTCTVTAAENEQVVEAALAGAPGFSPAWDLPAAGPAAAAIGRDGWFRCLPHRHGTDSFFAARLAAAARPEGGGAAVVEGGGFAA
jgi:16S rRNA (cytosine967-C5)-methyltransferase